MPAHTGAAISSNSEDTTMTQKFTISARTADRYLGDDEAHVGEYAGKLLTFAEACDAIVHLNRSRPDGHENVVYVANETERVGRSTFEETLVNETGLAELAEFLRDNHKSGDKFGPSELSAWATSAEQNADDGNGPMVEIGAAYSVTGAPICYRISPAGVTKTVRGA